MKLYNGGHKSKQKRTEEKTERTVKICQKEKTGQKNQDRNIYRKDLPIYSGERKKEKEGDQDEITARRRKNGGGVRVNRY